MASRIPLSFTDHWKSYAKISSEEDILIHFSEDLLHILCYKTDIGPIPRGIEVPKLPPPQYLNSPNWKNKIKGCYWCRKDGKDIQGVCCSIKCLYYLHEWCLDKVEQVTKIKNCRLPNCFQKCNETYLCCSSDHKKLYHEFSDKFPKIKRNKLFSPSWYDADLTSNPTVSRSKSPPLPKPPPLPNMDISIEVKNILIRETDVGPIPRSYKQEEHLSSKFSASHNWNVEINGCYQCSKAIKNKKEFLCSKDCYVIFNEWCRQKVSNTNRQFCKFPHCANRAINNGEFCGKNHERELKRKYPCFKKCLSQVSKGPKWYTSPNTNNSSNSPTNPFQKELQQTAKNEFIFSPLLTKFLYKDCDVGPIPRKLFELLPDIYSAYGLAIGNFNTIIPGCYWCCENNSSIYGIACSMNCFYLFNEWCHEKFKIYNTRRLCKFPSCDSTVTFGKECCKKYHIDKYNDDFVIKYSQELKSTNYALGPKWYLEDKSSNHIDFYNREDPFYEFTNFFPCSNLYIDHQYWTTTEHYFQAQKFVGTPHCESIRRLSAPRDAFEYSRRPNVQFWIRRDWNEVKELVMLKALEHKFSQDKYLKDLLIRTGDKKLFEHTRNDRFWGDGGDRRGQNRLGCLLMQVRFDLHGIEPFLPGRLMHYTNKDIQPSNVYHNNPNNHCSNPDNSVPNGEIYKSQDLPDNHCVLYCNYNDTQSDVTPLIPYGATPQHSTHLGNAHGISQSTQTPSIHSQNIKLNPFDKT